MGDFVRELFVRQQLRSACGLFIGCHCLRWTLLGVGKQLLEGVVVFMRHHGYPPSDLAAYG